MPQARMIVGAIALLALAGTGGCGGGDEPEWSEGQVIEATELSFEGNDYLTPNDPACVVMAVLTTSDEVEAAAEEVALGDPRMDGLATNPSRDAGIQIGGFHDGNTRECVEDATERLQALDR